MATRSSIRTALVTDRPPNTLRRGGSTRARLSVAGLCFALSCAADPQDTSPERPSKRSRIEGVADPAGNRLAIFGGNRGPISGQQQQSDFADDTWIFQPGEGWHRAPIGPGPSRRGRYAAAYDSRQQRMLIFGGRFRAKAQTGRYTLMNDVWAFDFASETWSLLTAATATVPQPRYQSVAAYDPIGDRLVVHAGLLNTSGAAWLLASDTWSFSLASRRWSPMGTTGDRPPTGALMSAAYDSKRNRLVMYGSMAGFNAVSNPALFALDLQSGQWTRLHSGAGSQTGNETPSNRFKAGLTYDADGDAYLMAAGHWAVNLQDDARVLNDAWLFSPADNTWTALRAGDSFRGGLGCGGNSAQQVRDYVDADLGSPERRQSAAFTWLSGRAYLFGGVSTCSEQLDDLWSLEPTVGSASWTEELGANSGESCIRRGDDCGCLCQ